MTADLPDLPDKYHRHVPAEFPDVPAGACKLAFVGEAPGDHEVEKGRPFVGPSGRVFDGCLRAANIDRAACLVTNAIDTKLIGNDLAKHRAALSPQAYTDLWECNLQRVRAELARVKPTVVVPLGGVACLQLLGDRGIAQLRGAPVYGRFAPYKHVPTFHPTHVLRDWRMFAVVVGDLIRAVTEVERGPEIVYSTRSLLIRPTIEDVEALPAEYGASDLLSCDIETGWGQIRGISFAPDAIQAAYVPFVDLSQPNRSYWRTENEERRAWAVCRTLLESPTPKLGQNFAAYDAIWLLRKAGIRVRNLRHDLRLLHAALYPELPKSLAFMASAYGGQGSWKHWAKHGTTAKEREEKRDA